MNLELCAVAVTGVCLALFSPCRAEYPLPKNLSGEWIRTPSDFSISENRRPLSRFVSSISLWGETGSQNARLKITQEKADISGSIRDNENVRKINIIPDSYAIGISGNFKFFSFTEP